MEVCWCAGVMQAVTLCVCVWCVVAVNGLGAEAMAALAPALGKLVSLTSLDLVGT